MNAPHSAVGAKGFSMRGPMLLTPTTTDKSHNSAKFGVETRVDNSSAYTREFRVKVEFHC